MRSNLTEAPPELGERTSHALTTWTLDLRAVTPIFKGGSRTDALDEGRPFRASSIKGLLRWWWRATRGETRADALREREKTLFGGIFGDELIASPVRVGVTDASSVTATKPQGADYALWVDRSRAGEKLYHTQATARLTVAVPTGLAAEVRPAVQAWLLLGGIGGRTRRGLGAVDSAHALLRPALPDVDALLAYIAGFAPVAAARDWPSLGGFELVVGQPVSDPMRAWLIALDTMRAVRMDTSHGQTRPVSLGFEPHRWHDDDYVPIRQGRSFSSPRAALGLPIQFQTWETKQRIFMNPRGASSRENRVPSPILVRPLRVGDAWLPAMVRLRIPYPRGVIANNVQGQIDPSGVDLFLADVARVPGWTRHAHGGAR